VTEPSVFRPNAVSYLRIPALDPGQAAAFYAGVFGWEIRSGGSAFTDGSGHVIGHFVSDQGPVGADGVRPYIYVEDLEATLAAIESHGGHLATAPYPEGTLQVATFRDPAGNEIGVWQRVREPAG
jgi:predicted enzyme related to lactoylglutathione lyase